MYHKKYTASVVYLKYLTLLGLSHTLLGVLKYTAWFISDTLLGVSQIDCLLYLKLIYCLVYLKYTTDWPV